MAHTRFYVAVAALAFVLSPQAFVAAQTAPTPGQSASVSAQSISAQNLADFDFMVDKITKNYAGYETKTAGAATVRLTALTAQLRIRAGAATTLPQLTDIMEEYIAFFKDEHTSVSAIASDSATPSNTGLFAPNTNLTEASAQRQLAALGNRRTPIEGIWSIDRTRYRLAVVRDTPSANTFSAVILSSTNEAWKPGMIKAAIAKTPTGAYAMTYRTGDFSQVPITPVIVGNGAILDAGNYGGWRNEWPTPPAREAMDKSFPSSDFYLRHLSPKTLWIRIPSFSDEHAATVAKLISDNKAAIDSADNLIIDVRRNGGGADFVYGPLSPLMYTRPVYEIGIEMRASQDNIALREALVERLASNPEARDTVAQLQRQIVRMKANVGTYFQPNSAPFSITRLERVLPFPKRIAVLMDRTGSTAEQFLLEARQSRKVTLMGQENSSGVLDFANVVSMKGPSGRFEVQWATPRSLRVPQDPVDEGGIAPDIRIPAAVTDPVTFAQRWLERQVD